MVEVTQKQMVTTSMMIQTVKTEVINRTSAKLNSTPFNLKKKTPQRILHCFPKQEVKNTIKYVNIYKLSINNQKIRIKIIRSILRTYLYINIK